MTTLSDTNVYPAVRQIPLFDGLETRETAPISPCQAQHLQYPEETVTGTVLICLAWLNTKSAEFSEKMQGWRIAYDTHAAAKLYKLQRSMTETQLRKKFASDCGCNCEGSPKCGHCKHLITDMGLVKHAETRNT
jgi:hypothetical protein